MHGYRLQYFNLSNNDLSDFQFISAFKNLEKFDLVKKFKDVAKLESFLRQIYNLENILLYFRFSVSNIKKDKF